MIPDIVVALRQVFLEAAEVSAEVGSHVYGTALPDAVTGTMPRKAVVIRAAGGGEVFSQGTLRHGDSRFDLRCYGETAAAAMRVWGTCHPVLKGLRRRVTDDALIHWARPAGGRQSLTEPDTKWPLVLCSWQVYAAEVVIT